MTFIILKVTIFQLNPEEYKNTGINCTSQKRDRNTCTPYINIYDELQKNMIKIVTTECN